MREYVLPCGEREETTYSLIHLRPEQMCQYLSLPFKRRFFEMGVEEAHTKVLVVPFFPESTVLSHSAIDKTGLS